MNIIKRTIHAGFTVALTLLGCGILSGAEVYVRPMVQYSVLSNNSATSSGAFGGGLALGASFGDEGRLEVGAEITQTKFNGYFVPFTYPNLNERVSAKYTVTPILATFRYSYATSSDALRPYLGVALGFTAVSVNEQGATHDGYGAVGGPAIGVRYRIRPTTYLNAGYQYFFSSDTSGILSGRELNFRYNAHVLSLALDQRF